MSQNLNPRICVFCPRPVSRHGEHIFPKWAHKLLPTSTHSYRATGSLGNITGKTKPRPGSPKNFTVRAVCHQCNNGWMGSLEEAAKPIILKLMKPQQPFVLTYDERKTLATWLSLKVLIVDADHPKQPLFTPEDYKLFVETRAPLSTAIFSMYWHHGSVAETVPFQRNTGGITDDNWQTMTTHIVNFTFSWPPVLFAAWVSRGAPAIHISETRYRSTMIWPAEKIVHWPPREPINGAQAAAVQNAAHLGQTIAIPSQNA